MTTRHLAASIAVSLAVLTSCAAGRPSIPTIVHLQTNEEDTAYSAALRALVQAGYEISTGDKESGIIQTKWKDATPDAVKVLAAGSKVNRRVVVSIEDGSASVRVEAASCYKPSIYVPGEGNCTVSPYTSDELIAEQSSIAKRISAAIRKKQESKAPVSGAQDAPESEAN